MNFIHNFKNILVLCAHTDDEFGCAGTISKLAKKSVEINYIAFSSCQDSVPKEFPEDILIGECMDAKKVLGIKKERVKIKDFQVRYFPKNRQEILEELVLINKTIKPDLVFLPSSSDIHQDHTCIHEEGMRAFKYSSILGYELPQNSIGFSNNGYVN
jgi:N-acetylglucosamine malate deacetylase 1